MVFVRRIETPVSRQYMRQVESRPEQHREGVRTCQALRRVLSHLLRCIQHKGKSIMAKTVAALFDKRTEAFGTVQELVDHEFARGDISLMTHDDTPREGSTTTDYGRSGGAQGARIDAAL